MDLLYEDESLLAVNKPAGMVVHPAPGHWSGTFANALAYHVRAAASAPPAPGTPPPPSSPPLSPRDGERGQAPLPDALGDGLRPGIVHRLDRYTSGVLLGAKTLDAQRSLLAAFAERRVLKVYLAVTAGWPGDAPAIAVDTPIGRHPVDRVKMAALLDGGGRAALSMIHPLASDGGLGLVAVRIGTGRTHQIRVHLQQLNCPVLGDPVYGDTRRNAKERRRAPRPLLHAYRLQTDHPVRAQTEPLRIVAPLPPDLAAVAAALTGIKERADLDEWLAARVDGALAAGSAEFDDLMRTRIL